ncbi:MAG: ABC transporter ATP-binding protein [Chloroflexi bacterium]|nr:ABC transporter ATP-binding protein [Chloroflexota bacterium]
MSAQLRRQPNYMPPPDRCTAESLIEMSQIVKTFKNASGEFVALRGVTACFYPGEFVSVVGKSGSGKSTLVNMITGIDHPTSGAVRVGDTYVHNLSENDMSIWRGKNLGIVFQFYQLLPTLTLLENVMLPMVLSKLFSPSERERRARELLDLVGLAQFAEKLPAAVSGGQQQSAAIARALSSDPPILIADEPTGNLDSRTADEVFALFASLIDRGKTILMVTHDISLAKRTTRTLLISDGELISPWVAGALPWLGHSQMLWLTHHLKPQLYEAGRPLRETNLDSEWLFILTDGSLDVTDGEGLAERVAFKMHPGAFLSSLELKAMGLAQASLRVSGDEPAEILFTGGADFAAWLKQDLLTPEKLAHKHSGESARREYFTL